MNLKNYGKDGKICLFWKNKKTKLSCWIVDFVLNNLILCAVKDDKSKIKFA